MRQESDDGGWAATAAGAGRGENSRADLHTRGADGTEISSPPPRLEAYVQHTTRAGLIR
jgi:hypothetical protein